MVKPRRKSALRNWAYSRRRSLSSMGRSNMANSHMARYPESANRLSGIAQRRNLQLLGAAPYDGSQRKGHPGEPIKKRARLLLEGEAAEQRLDEAAFGIAVEIDRISAFRDQLRYDAVNHRPKGFHQVVGQAKGVIP